MDKATVAGILVAVGGIVLGLLLEGGNLWQVLQPTAAIIVFGGTFGAVLIQFPLPVVVGAVRRLAGIFFAQDDDSQRWVKELVGYANQARRVGIISLDQELPAIDQPFLSVLSCWLSMAPSRKNCAR